MVCLHIERALDYTLVLEFCFSDVKIVTEMPKDMFKRPKLNKYSNAVGSSSVTGGGKKDGNELFKPSFSRRNIKKPDFPSGETEFSYKYQIAGLISYSSNYIFK